MWGGGITCQKATRSQKFPIVNKLLPLYVRLSRFPCRLLYVLNEFYTNKGQLYGNEIAFFQKNRVFPDYKHSAAYGQANEGGQEVRFTPFIHPIRTFSPPF